VRLLSGCGLLSRALAVLSLLGVAASAVGLAPRPVVAQDLDRTGAIWGPYLEWSLANPSYEGNPYDLVADVTFRHPSGRAHTTEMFYQSGVTWKFRFTGTELGMWSFATSSSDPDLDGRSGTVTIGPNHDPGMKGFVASRFVDDDNGSRWIRTATGEAFIPQYVMYYLADDPAQIDAEIGTFIGEHGFTGFHIPVFCRWFDLGSPSCRTLPESSRAGSIEVARAALEEALRRGGLRLVRPGDAPPCASSGPNPDGRTFEILETIITKTYAAGGVVHLWMWGDEQRGQTPHTIGGLNGGPDRRLQRYVAARLGPLPGWTMGYGFDLDEWTSREDLRRWHAYMHDHLGWPHMLGGRSAGPNRGTDHRGQQIYDGLDYAAYEHHQPSYDVYVAALRHLPRIPAFSEDRFRIRLSGAYREKDFDHEMTRATMWDSAMAGGIANIWGRLGGDGAADRHESGSDVYDNRAQLKTYSRFFAGRFLPDMVRDNVITDGHALRSGNTRYLFHKPNAASVRLDLSGMAGPQPAVAVDAKKPYREIAIDPLDPRDQTWRAPYASDWAIAVGDFGGVGG
jgi:hypothetical protein